MTLVHLSSRLEEECSFRIFADEAFARGVPDVPHGQPFLPVPNKINCDGHFALAPDKVGPSDLSVAYSLDACHSRYVNFFGSVISDGINKVHNGSITQPAWSPRTKAGRIPPHLGRGYVHRHLPCRHPVTF